MAIYHLSVKAIQRSAGRSAVAAAAYRAGARLVDDRTGLIHDYTRKAAVDHTELVGWESTRQELWDMAEAAERRKDGTTAREYEIALPAELTRRQKIELARDYAQWLHERHGVAVDVCLHGLASENPHAHLLTTTRESTGTELGGKVAREWSPKKRAEAGLGSRHEDLIEARQVWEALANVKLALAGHEIRIDHRSNVDRGIELEPSTHVGIHAAQMKLRGLPVDRERMEAESAARNKELLQENPALILKLVADEKSVFTRQDIARCLHRHVDGAVEFESIFLRALAAPELVELQAERKDPETGKTEQARYSTRETIDLEAGMIRSAMALHGDASHEASKKLVERAIERQNKDIQSSTGNTSARLSDEQARAIEHVTGPQRISAVVGFAGAGKSTMLAAARDAWEAQGYRVHGAALSGKAAEGLEESSGIESRTLAAWRINWDKEKHQLGKGDVFVIDEAGMVSSKELARFIHEAEGRGAKIVLVGDHEQLQAIGAGAPFRAIAERIGHSQLSEVRRQQSEWQRNASVQFATHKTAEALQAYRDHGAIQFREDSESVRNQIVHDYLADYVARPDGTRVAMAHRRADVKAINDEIRTVLLNHGLLRDIRSYTTNDGERQFGIGDRVVFLENNRDLNVKNGLLGTVVKTEGGELGVKVDGRDECVQVALSDYKAIDHGYATTVHKNQGATVDKAFVLASSTMDRHLAYVAMTRHRDSATLYAATDEFNNAGRLVGHGAAPYEHNPANRMSYYVTLADESGKERTLWGVDFKNAMEEAAPEIGDKIALEHAGTKEVRLPNGKTVERNTWRIADPDTVAYSQLEKRLSRSGAKETTLDYAERRDLDAVAPLEAELKAVRERLQVLLVGEFEPSPKLASWRKQVKTAEMNYAFEIGKEDGLRNELKDHLQSRPKVIGRKAWDQRKDELETALKEIEKEGERIKIGQERLDALERQEWTAYEAVRKTSEQARRDLVTVEKVEKAIEAEPALKKTTLKDAVQYVLKAEHGRALQQARVDSGRVARDQEERARKKPAPELIDHHSDVLIDLEVRERYLREQLNQDLDPQYERHLLAQVADVERARAFAGNLAYSQLNADELLFEAERQRRQASKPTYDPAPSHGPSDLSR